MKSPIEGYWPQRWLPDGRFLGVVVVFGNRGRLCLGDETEVEEFWCFGHYSDAVAAYERFPEEPARWTRHWPSDRRRPGGDPALEYGRGEEDPRMAELP